MAISDQGVVPLITFFFAYYLLRTHTLWEPAPLALMPEWGSRTSLASSLEAVL